MKRHTLPLCLIPLLSIGAVQAADVQQGQKLIEADCQGCHDSGVYTQPNRKVTTLPGLHNQVRFCTQNLKLLWFDEEVENAATYLNQEYYKLKE